MQKLCGKTQNQWTVRKSCPSRRYIILARNRLLTYPHLKCRTANMKYFEKTLVNNLINTKVKFPHSPILHYAISSWIEKTMTKTIHCHWENRFVLQ